jgi:outer membrane cobalamin receptor
MKRLPALFFLLTLPLLGQSRSGELHFTVTDPSGLGVRATIEVVSDANQYRNTFSTDETGNVGLKRLPYGGYRIAIEAQGFATHSQVIEVLSAIPINQTIALTLAPVTSSVTVKDWDMLVDPHRSGSINEIGSDTIETRPASLPGRSLQDLVNTQPGWLYEGNAVLHPRGSEYQTQFVVDGVPFTDNRSPSFAPEIEADDVQSMTIYTAGIPAEFGRKIGGVVEINTARDTRADLHGQFILSGGSFDTAGAFGTAQYVRGKNTFGVSADGDMTDHYLNPVVPQNFTNRGTTAGFAVSYERDLSSSDRIRLTVRHGLARFLVPNEQVQEAAGQRQDRDTFETVGIVSYQHIFSPNVIADFRGMVRDDSTGLSSNPQSTPIIAYQDRGFREGYFKGSVSVHHGRHEWKAGIESDAIFLREQFSDIITDPTQFDPGTPTTFSFNQKHADLEQSAFIQDLIRLGKWTLSAGLRWDHYQLLVNQNAVSPRFAVARYFPSADLVLHASYDRVFQTPFFENLLLSSSPQAISLNPNILRLPVEPSHGNYYEIGATKGFFRQLRLDVNVFDRRVNNYADDDQLLNTGISFPIAFAKANLYGAEGKIEIPRWGNLSGFVSYSYIVGSTYFPVTGGLLVGVDAVNSARLTGRFWDSQDQRNTLRTRFRYHFIPRVWAAIGGEYGSGLPVAFNGSQEEAIATYGQQVVDRVNFDRDRVKPSLSIDASIGVEMWRRDNFRLRLQADAENVNNRLNVIDFAGLFSGNAIAPPRSYAVRLETTF